MRSDNLLRGVIPYLPEEIDGLEEESRRFLAGEVAPGGFREFRLQQGLYGQKQAERHMLRVKVPFGGITSTQLRVLAEIADQTERGVGHVTTRQNMQFHFLELAQVPPLMRRLGEAGLTTREACGNTVRNVTACPLAGVCRDESWDVTPAAAAIARFFVRNPICQKLPRKFKISLSGCAHDCALSPIHDIGLVAVTRVEGGGQKRGFLMRVGGGLGTVPHPAPVLFDFVPEEELLRRCEAVVRAFDRLGDRKRRMRARMKFVVQKLGIDAFRREVEKELAALPPAEAYDYAVLSQLPEERPVPPDSGALAGGNGSESFERWHGSNVEPQKQAGHYVVHLRLYRGDVTGPQMRALASAIEQFADGRVRTTLRQNLVVRWVHESSLPPLYAALVKADLAQPDAQTISDITACPGADSCALGITSSRGLTEALTEALASDETLDPLLRKLQIKISGCPNSCGHHHLADIGFHGCSVNQAEDPVPSYQLLLGGGVDERGGRIGVPVLKVAAKRVPEVVARVMACYRGERRGEERFEAFVQRLGLQRFKALLADLQASAPPEEGETLFFDWGAKEKFTVQVGEGECSA